MKMHVFGGDNMSFRVGAAALELQVGCPTGSSIASSQVHSQRHLACTQHCMLIPVTQPV